MYTTFKDLKQCQSLEANQLICEHNEPIFLSNSRQVCEVTLLITHNRIPQNCNVGITCSFNEICQIIYPNSWIYVSNEIKTTISCANHAPR